MKRSLRTVLISCLMCCLLPISVSAASSTYDVNEIGMHINLPSDYVVFTRDIHADDPNLSKYGFTKDKLLTHLQEANIYLDAWDEAVEHEIVIVMEEDLSGDYHQYSDTELTTMISSYGTGFADAGIQLIDSGIYRHSQAKFTKFSLSQTENGEALYVMQYHTIYDGKSIVVTLYSYCGEIDATEATAFQGMIDSIRFDAEPQLPPAPAQTEAFTYTDSKSGMTFSVPANWVEVPTKNEDPAFTSARFDSTEEAGLCIVFISTDLFEDEAFLAELEAAGQQSLGRDAVGNDILTTTDLAEMYGFEESLVSMVSYGGKEYFSAEALTTVTEGDLTATLPVSYLIRCENGYIYIFQFNGTKDSPYFSDLEQLVSSAAYPVFESGKAAAIGSGILSILTALMITLVAYGAFPLIYARTRSTVITKKKYNILCYAVNCIVFLLFAAIEGKPSTSGPYILWTGLFSASGVKILRERGVLEGFLPFERSTAQTDHTEQTEES